MKRRRTVAAIAGQRLFDDHGLVAFQRRHGHLLVTGHEHATVDQIHLIDQRFQRVELADAPLRGVLRGSFEVERVDAHYLDVRAVNLANGLIMKRRRKSRADYPRAHGLLLHDALPEVCLRVHRP